MFLTVTANSALDRIFFIDEFIPGGTMRTRKVVDGVGGKGFDASVTLRALGQETLSLGFVAGTNGRDLVRLLDQYGIQHELVWVDGNSRMAHVICESSQGRHSHLTAGGYSVRPEQVQHFYTIFEKKLAEAQWMVGAGSLPQGIPDNFYRTLVETADRYHKPSLIDSSGLPGREAAAARPTVLKMNRAEFAETFEVEVEPLETLIQSAVGVRRRYRLNALVVTCGEKGLVAITPEHVFTVTGPVQKVVNSAGAGDAASAALAWRLSLDDPWPSALRWAAATSAASVLTETTADCHPGDIHRLLPEVEVRRLGIDQGDLG